MKKTLWLNWGRGFGKTSRLAEICRRDPDAVFVTFTRQEAKRVSEDFELPRDQVIAVHDLREGLQKRRRRNTYLVVDNLDLMFQTLFECRVEAVTTSSESIRIREEPEEHPLDGVG